MKVNRQLQARAALPPRKRSRYPLDRRLGEPQSRPGRRGEEKILDPVETRTPTPWSASPLPVAIPTTLSRLLYFQIKYFKLQVFAGNIKSVLEEASETANTTCNTGHTSTPVLYSSQWELLVISLRVGHFAGWLNRNAVSFIVLLTKTTGIPLKRTQNRGCGFDSTLLYSYV
jgi:hypothetical protein